MYEAIKWNIWKSRLLLAVAIVFISIMAYVFSRAYNGSAIVPVALVLAIILTIGSYYNSDKIVLMSMHAEEADKNKYAHYVNSVEGLALAAGVPAPRAYVVDDPAPNAFATGRDPAHAVICVTTGLLKIMDRAEMEGVIAHEMSHVKNYDIRFMTVIAVLVGFTALLADWFRWGARVSYDDDDRNSWWFMLLGLLLAAIAPIAVSLVQAAISRKREYLADASGALLTRYPLGLASALRKIAASPEVLRSTSGATAHMFIVNPLDTISERPDSLLDTHPPLQDRIRKLEAM